MLFLPSCKKKEKKKEEEVKSASTASQTTEGHLILIQFVKEQWLSSERVWEIYQLIVYVYFKEKL